MLHAGYQRHAAPARGNPPRPERIALLLLTPEHVHGIGHLVHHVHGIESPLALAVFTFGLLRWWSRRGRIPRGSTIAAARWWVATRRRHGAGRCRGRGTRGRWRPTGLGRRRIPRRRGRIAGGCARRIPLASGRIRGSSRRIGSGGGRHARGGAISRRRGRGRRGGRGLRGLLGRRIARGRGWRVTGRGGRSVARGGGWRIPVGRGWRVAWGGGGGISGRLWCPCPGGRGWRPPAAAREVHPRPTEAGHGGHLGHIGRRGIRRRASGPTGGADRSGTEQGEQTGRRHAMDKLHRCPLLVMVTRNRGRRQPYYTRCLSVSGRKAWTLGRLTAVGGRKASVLAREVTGPPHANPKKARTRCKSAAVSTPGPGSWAAISTWMASPCQRTRNCSRDSAPSGGAGGQAT